LSDGLILLNGELSDAALVKRLARRCGAVICADGGARHAAKLGLEPHFVVGDMDSLPKPLPASWRKTVYWCDFDESRSDFEKALDFARDIGCDRLYVAGATGGRLDHELVNVSVAAREGRRAPLAMVGRGVAQLVGPGRCPVPAAKGKTFSLLAAGGPALVTLAGARYPLKRSRLVPGSRGLSNLSAGSPSLTVHSGWVWLVTDVKG
jgi:thiamine pyrophosphokinase